MHFYQDSIMRIAAALAITTLFAATAMASPTPMFQKDEKGQTAQEGVDTILQTISSGCGDMSEQMRKTPGIGGSLSARPEKALCECVDQRLRAAPVFVELRSFDAAKLEALVVDPAFKDYLVGKLTATMFTCVTDELNIGADAIKPAM
jgi:hypothetical protein